jgi:hypothetical protein
VQRYNSLFNSRPVDMPSGSSKVACRWICNCQLTDSQSRTGCRIESCSQCNPQKVIKASCKFAIHLMLSQGRSQEEMQGIVHPTKSLAVTQQLHYQGGRGQDRHSRNKFRLGNEVIHSGEKETKGGMQDFTTKVRCITILDKYE